MPSPSHKPRASLSLANTGAAVRRGDIKISDPIPIEQSGSLFVNNKNTVPPTRIPSDYPLHDSTWPRKSSIAPDVHLRHASAGHIPMHSTSRASAGPSLIPSSMSSVPSKASLSQKKDGGFRATLKRMFSSKRHKSAPSYDTVHQYYRSESANLNTVAERHPTPPPGPSPISGNVVREVPPESTPAHPPHEELDDDDELAPPRRRRRNTLPSLVFSERESGFVAAATGWAAGESEREQKRAEEDSTSDSQFKRRSRSAEALNNLARTAKVEPSPTRDRAGEIAFWRNSAVQNPVPVYSGQSINVDPSHLIGAAVSETETRTESSLGNPLDNFDFGLERASNSLEQRVNTLEIKLFDFEYALAKLQGNNISKPQVNRQPGKRGSIHGIFPEGSSTQSASTSSLALSSSLNVNEMTFLSSPGRSPEPPVEGDELFRANRASHATTVTVRPATARRRSSRHSGGLSPGSPRSIHLSPSHYDILLEMLKSEQAAREALEKQVSEMKKEMEVLRTPIYATIREAYPTPSPESTTGGPRVRPLHRSHPFANNELPLPVAPEVSRFSTTSTDGDSGSEEEEEDLDDDGFQDVYETQEEPKPRNTFETARGSPVVMVG